MDLWAVGVALRLRHGVGAKTKTRNVTDDAYWLGGRATASAAGRRRDLCRKHGRPWTRSSAPPDTAAALFVAIPATMRLSRCAGARQTANKPTLLMVRRYRTTTGIQTRSASLAEALHHHSR